MENVVRLWCAVPEVASANAERQLELFRTDDFGTNQVAFLDIEVLDQEKLFKIITYNSASAILDIRPRPVFRKPKFVHSEVSRYFSDNRVHYFDYAAAISDPDFIRPHEIARRVNLGRGEGLTICLYDVNSRERGWIDRARRMLRRSKLFTAELSPRALGV